MSSGNFTTGQPSVPTARFALPKLESLSPAAATVRSAASRVTGNQESKGPTEEGTFDMLHYALAEAQALQRVAASVHSGAQVESPIRLQIQQDLNDMHHGINI